MSIEKLSTIWPEWKVVEQLGEGSFGKVYKVVREEHTVTSHAAVKVISIPQSDAELASMRSEGLDENGTRSYFEGIVTDFVNEIKLMESMKGTSNIVSVEDYKVLEKTDKIGWDIFIRMELLTPFNDYIADKKLTEVEVIKLGKDVCSALELCAQRNVIHRDIKPENIFVSSFGDFKVGDFGIARELEKTSGSLSSKGTYNYMAPEVTTSRHYDATVDIYSLGLVLYKLLNNNRLPFLDPNAQLIQYQDRKNAIDRRFSGEALPAPSEASPHMAQVILVACAFKPAERFQTPTAFKNALGSVKGDKPSAPPPPLPPVDMNATVAARRAPEAANTPANQTGTFGKEKKKASKAKKIFIAVVAVICVAGIVTGTLYVSSLFKKDNTVDEPSSSPSETESSTTDPSETPSAITPPSKPGTVSLFSLTPVNSREWNPNEGELEDSLGTKYTANNPYIIVAADWFGEYFVNAEYNTLKGKLAPHKNIREDASVQFQVFADDRLVYSSSGITRKTLAFDFEANISGAKYVKIAVTYEGYSSNTDILAMDMVLSSEPVSGANDNPPISSNSVSLLTLTPVNYREWNPNRGELEDSLGNQYSVTMPYIIIAADWYGEYFVDGQYSTLKGRLAPHKKIRDDASVQFQVFADDKLVYSSVGITRKTRVFDFEANISGAKFIKIAVNYEGYSSNTDILAMDMVLVK